MPSSSSTNVATLIAADRLDHGTLAEAADRLRVAGVEPGEQHWLDQGHAADIGFDGDIEASRNALRPMETMIDIAVQAQGNRRKMLLVSDMDSTMITVECIDELADYAGIKLEIAAITERAMAGELDFAEALTARVALLAGLKEDVITQALHERVRPMPGANALVKTMNAWGAHSILVSGGFTHFTGPVAQQIGLAEAHANLLEIEGGELTGRLNGDIVDADTKRKILLSAAAARSLPINQVLVVGDGANDLPMIAAAAAGQGLGVGYHPRPKLADAANFSVRHGDLTALLYAQGMCRADWVLA
jgi:phosphoserine phosphatase